MWQANDTKPMPVPTMERKVDGSFTMNKKNVGPMAVIRDLSINSGQFVLTGMCHLVVDSVRTRELALPQMKCAVLSSAADLSAFTIVRFGMNGATGIVSDIETDWLQPLISSGLYAVSGKLLGWDQQNLLMSLLTQLGCSVGSKTVYGPLAKYFNTL